MQNINKILHDNKLLYRFPASTYQFCIVRIKDSKAEFLINTVKDTGIYDNVVKYINDQNFDTVFITARSEKEPYTTAFPAVDDLKTIVNNLNSKVNIFYQEPWPEAVPKFKLGKNDCVLRFGYDESIKFNTKTVDVLFDINDSADAVIPCLINNKKIIPLC